MVCMLPVAEDETKPLHAALFELEGLGLLPAFSIKDVRRKVHGQNCEGTLDASVWYYACLLLDWNTHTFARTLNILTITEILCCPLSDVLV